MRLVMGAVRRSLQQRCCHFGGVGRVWGLGAAAIEAGSQVPTRRNFLIRIINFASKRT